MAYYWTSRQRLDLYNLLTHMADLLGDSADVDPAREAQRTCIRQRIINEVPSLLFAFAETLSVIIVRPKTPLGFRGQ
jgi:hypothetical protein